MSKAIDYSGQKYNKLTLLFPTKPAVFNGRKHGFYYMCLCECGNQKEIWSNSVVSGKTKSCGCLNKSKPSNNITHHKSNTKLYHIYKGMKSRCYNTKNKAYPYYGARGIHICEIWLGKDGAKNFIEWAETNGYKEGLSIDRIDVNGNYEPNNCRWVTHHEQMFNRSNSIVLEGVNISEYVSKTGIISRKTAYRRYKDGWNVWDIITIPTLKGGQKLEAWKKAHPEHEKDIARTRAELARL